MGDLRHSEPRLFGGNLMRFKIPGISFFSLERISNEIATSVAEGVRSLDGRVGVSKYPKLTTDAYASDRASGNLNSLEFWNLLISKYMRNPSFRFSLLLEFSSQSQALICRKNKHIITYPYRILYKIRMILCDDTRYLSIQL